MYTLFSILGLHACSFFLRWCSFLVVWMRHPVFSGTSYKWMLHPKGHIKRVSQEKDQTWILNSSSARFSACQFIAPPRPENMFDSVRVSAVFLYLFNFQFETWVRKMKPFLMRTFDSTSILAQTGLIQSLCCRFACSAVEIYSNLRHCR